MQKPFQMSDEMLKELANEVTPKIVEGAHDSTGEGPRQPSLRRRPINLQDRGSAASGSSNDITTDPINPAHYRNHPSGVECIQITEWMNFNLGNTVKYIWRAGDKGAQIEDLEKARWYLDREIARLKGMNLMEVLR